MSVDPDRLRWVVRYSGSSHGIVAVFFDLESDALAHFQELLVADLPAVMYSVTLDDTVGEMVVAK